MFLLGSIGDSRADTLSVAVSGCMYVVYQTAVAPMPTPPSPTHPAPPLSSASVFMSKLTRSNLNASSFSCFSYADASVPSHFPGSFSVNIREQPSVVSAGLFIHTTVILRLPSLWSVNYTSIGTWHLWTKEAETVKRQAGALATWKKMKHTTFQAWGRRRWRIETTVRTHVTRHAVPLLDVLAR